MSPRGFSMPLVWTLFGAYVALTYFLAWLGYRRTRSFRDFAVGRADMGPGLAGITLGACLASTATFVINPGFVYAYGLPALLTLTVPLFAGIFTGLFVLGPGFRRRGAKATTLPVWIGDRYGSGALRAWFAALSVLNIFYLVLMVVGGAIVMSATMGVSYGTAVALNVAIVFSYVFLGGTYAHAYTNVLQGVLMAGVALVIFVKAVLALGAPADAAATLRAADPALVAITAPASPFYRNLFEVLACPFLMGFAIIAQPHLLLKANYLERPRDMMKLAVTGGSCFVIFSLVLVAGLAARVSLGGGIPQDQAMAVWLGGAFSPLVGSVVTVLLVATATSTADGLLVAVSCIIGGDLVAHPGVARRLGVRDEEARARLAFRAGRVTIVALGAVAWIVALDPPALVGLFGTVGTYGLLVASLPAIVLGILFERPPSATGVFAASVVALAVHFGLFYGGVTLNTGLTASAALAIAMPTPFVIDAVRRWAARAPAPVVVAVEAN